MNDAIDGEHNRWALVVTTSSWLWLIHNWNRCNSLTKFRVNELRRTSHTSLTSIPWIDSLSLCSVWPLLSFHLKLLKCSIDAVSAGLCTYQLIEFKLTTDTQLAFFGHRNNFCNELINIEYDVPNCNDWMCQLNIFAVKNQICFQSSASQNITRTKNSIKRWHQLAWNSISNHRVNNTTNSYSSLWPDIAACDAAATERPCPCVCSSKMLLILLWTNTLRTIKIS